MYIEEFKKIEVSFYKNVRTSRGGFIRLADFLATDYSKEVMRLRSATDPQRRKLFKQYLPAVTISGVFSPTRRLGDLISPTGLICIDIDAADNPDRNLEGDFPEELTGWDIISYLSHSASGKGLFAIVKVAWPFYHAGHFEALVKDFSERGFKIDRACGDLTRLRCATYEPSPYYNPDARVYDNIVRFETIAKPLTKPVPPPPVFDDDPKDTVQLVSILLANAIRARRFVLDDYTQWIRTAFSLSGLGESGRRLFHTASATSSKYTPEETDRVFDYAVKHSRGLLNVGSFIRLLNQ